MGWVRLDVPPGDPRFGKAFPCPACGRKREQERLSALSGLIGELVDSNFNVRIPFHETVRPVAAFLRAAALSDRPAGFVAIAGGYGVGKSHLLAATANTAMDNGWTVLYIIAKQFLNAIKGTFGKNDNEYDKLVRKFQSVDVLCLDELDKVQMTDWAANELFALLNQRYMVALGTGKASLTIMALNRPPHELPGYLLDRLNDNRISRIFELWDAPNMRRMLSRDQPVDGGPWERAGEAEAVWARAGE